MYPYIVCYCGRCLSDIYDLFCVMRDRKYATAYADLGMDIDPIQIAISGAMDVDLADVFEQLNLHLDCCRTRMHTQVEFREFY